MRRQTRLATQSVTFQPCVGWSPWFAPTVHRLDDLVLLAESKQGVTIKHRIGTTHVSKLVPLADSSWEVKCNVIPIVQPGETSKYFEARTDILQPSHTWLERIEEAFLKPHQKLQLLRQFANNTYNSTVLYHLQRLINKSVRSILHLPSTSSDNFIILPMALGGLGIPAINIIANKLHHSSFIRLAKSADPIIRSLYATVIIQQLSNIN